MKKLIISIIMLFVLSSVALAVTRTTSTNTVTYTKQNSMSGMTKGYWAVEDTLSGCTFTSVSCPVNSYYSCGKSGNAIRVVGHSDASGANIPNSVVVTVVGSGTCSLSGNYAEAWKDTSAHLGVSTAMASGTLSLASCRTAADTNCNGCIQDSEFPTAVLNWKQQTGGITDSIFPTIVINWKQQTGC